MVVLFYRVEYYAPVKKNQEALWHDPQDIVKWKKQGPDHLLKDNTICY